MTENESNLLKYYERTVKECMEECDGNCIMYSEGNCECVDANVLDHLRELQHYRAIGTIEEFKALKEKSVAKKPIRDKEFSSLFECPTCGRRQKITYELYHCKECGQKLDWQ